MASSSLTSTLRADIVKTPHDPVLIDRNNCVDDMVENRLQTLFRPAAVTLNDAALSGNGCLWSSCIVHLNPPSKFSSFLK